MSPVPPAGWKIAAGLLLVLAGPVLWLAVWLARRPTAGDLAHDATHVQIKAEWRQDSPWKEREYGIYE